MANGENVETASDFIFLGSRINVDSDCSHEIKRYLLLGRKAMTNLDNTAKSRDITLPTKVHIVKVMVFPVVMYGYERWTIKKAEHPLLEKCKSNYIELSPHSCQNGHHQNVYKQ